MTDHDLEPSVELSAFSSEGARATPWATALDRIRQAHVCWLSTVRPDGRPHVTPLLATWHDAGLYFTTGGAERKARNLDRDPRCVMTTGTDALTGLDVVIEGAARLVDVPAERRAAAAAFEDKYGEHLTSPEGTWHGLGEAMRTGDVLLFCIHPAVGFAFGRGETFSQTRYAFRGQET